jgi:guanine deaminase
MDLARRHDIPVYTHIYESRGMALQARLSLPQYSGLLIRRLAEEGVLDQRLNFAHSVWLSRQEIDLLAEHAAGVVLNPQGNLKMKCGIAPTARFRDHIATGRHAATLARSRPSPDHACSWKALWGQKDGRPAI